MCVCSSLFHHVHVYGTWSGGHEFCCRFGLSLVRSYPLPAVVDGDRFALA